MHDILALIYCTVLRVKCKPAAPLWFPSLLLSLFFPEKSKKLLGDSPINMQLLILIGAPAGALVVILVIVILLVNRCHQHKNKKLVRQLGEKM